PASEHRPQQGAACRRAVVAGAPAGAGDARPAGILARLLRRGEDRDARPLSAPSLAGRPVARPGYAPGQAARDLGRAHKVAIRCWERGRDPWFHLFVVPPEGGMKRVLIFVLLGPPCVLGMITVLTYLAEGRVVWQSLQHPWMYVLLAVPFLLLSALDVL